MRRTSPQGLRPDSTEPLDTGQAGPFLITQPIIKLPTEAIPKLSDRAAALLCRIEATSGDYYEAGQNAALAIGLKKRHHIKPYRDELLQGGWITLGGRSHCGSYQLRLTDKSKQATQTIPSALLNDLQGDDGDVGLIRLAAHLSKLCNGSEARVTWSKLANGLNKGVNTIPRQMAVLRDRYQWVNFRNEGKRWLITPGASMDGWKSKKLENVTAVDVASAETSSLKWATSLTQMGHQAHSNGPQSLSSISLSSLSLSSGRTNRGDSCRSAQTASIEKLKADQKAARLCQQRLDRAGSIAREIVDALGDAYAGETSDSALKGLVTVLADEILGPYTKGDAETVYEPVSLWLRLYNCAQVQHPLRHPGGIISLLRRCKEHGLKAAFPDNWAKGPMYWSADAEEKFEDRTSLATLRDQWISELSDIKADNGYSWHWLVEVFDLRQTGQLIRQQYENQNVSGLDCDDFWEWRDGGRCFLDLEADPGWL